MKKSLKVIYIKQRHLAVAGLLVLAVTIYIFGSLIKKTQRENDGAVKAAGEVKNQSTAQSAENTTTTSESESIQQKYLKWVEFHVTKEALQQAYEYDVNTHGDKTQLHFVELLAYLGAKYGGDFSRYKAADMEQVAKQLADSKATMEEFAKNMPNYLYYREAYGAVLEGMVGEYQVQESSAAEDSVTEEATKKETSKEATNNTKWVTKYGLKSFHPIAKGFPYSDYDDFGVSRSYGYKRNHLGHDMMGQVGTPVIAVESGCVVELGWNQYGGWRIGINSFDKKRYYYYAHLRQNSPFAKGLKKGSVVQAGDVIGYMGRTGYSSKENVNNIDTYHLHFGLQLIFDESQREGTNQIWVDPYPLINFLYQNQSETVRNDKTKERKRLIPIRDPIAQAYKEKDKTGKEKTSDKK